MIALAIMLGTTIKAYAGNQDSGRGWLWGGSENPPDAVINGNETGLGWVSINNVDNAGTAINGAISYGVKIPAINGAVTGYGWSENYGWISFNGADLAGCPQAAAARSGNTLTGGARILSIRDGGLNAGGWLGCISLSGTLQDLVTPYGVDITKMNGTGANPTYAWSDELGWIDFSRSVVVDPCVPTAWLPDPSTVCSGVNFNQSNGCDAPVSTVGTGAGVWTPPASDTCSSLTVTQTKCGDEARIITGTKACKSQGWREVAPTN